MDARSLLRAKKAEARVEHPYASYNASGVLRCSICAVPVKQWDAHILTKQHRTSVAREKASQAKLAAKRSAPESSGPPSKRARNEVEVAEEAPTGLPAGFFSAGNQPLASADDDDEEGDDKGTQAVASTSAPLELTGDQELDDFFASLEEDTPAAVPAPEVKKRVYQSSSSAAIPGVASYESAPVLVQKEEEQEQAEESREVEETEEEKRARSTREEREEIMGRLEEEERAQEDADSRVVALKARMEALKKRREGRPVKGKPGKEPVANGTTKV